MLLRFESKNGQFRLNAEATDTFASLSAKILNNLPPDTDGASIILSPKPVGNTPAPEQERRLADIPGLRLEQVQLKHGDKLFVGYQELAQLSNGRRAESAPTPDPREYSPRATRIESGRSKLLADRRRQSEIAEHKYSAPTKPLTPSSSATFIAKENRSPPETPDTRFETSAANLHHSGAAPLDQVLPKVRITPVETGGRYSRPAAHDRKKTTHFQQARDKIESVVGQIKRGRNVSKRHEFIQDEKERLELQIRSLPQREELNSPEKWYNKRVEEKVLMQDGIASGKVIENVENATKYRQVVKDVQEWNEALKESSPEPLIPRNVSQPAPDTRAIEISASSNRRTGSEVSSTRAHSAFEVDSACANMTDDNVLNRTGPSKTWTHLATFTARHMSTTKQPHSLATIMGRLFKKHIITSKYLGNAVFPAYTLETVTTFQEGGPFTTRGKTSRSLINWVKAEDLGEGIFGEVHREYQEDDPQTPSSRAVKVLRRRQLSHMQIDYKRELGALLRLSCDEYKHNFVEFYSWYENVEKIFIAMEYIPGGDLSRYVKEGGMSEVDAKLIATQISDGICVLHRLDVVHRDIKPANVFVVTASPNWHVKIGDFGICKNTITRHTALHTTVGTDGYQAPEVLGIVRRPKGNWYDSKRDVWSFGCLLHELTTGLVPFADLRAITKFCTSSRIKRWAFLDKPLRHAKHNYPAEITVLLLNTLRPDPAYRWTAEEAAASTLEWLQGLSQSRLRGTAKPEEQKQAEYDPIATEPGQTEGHSANDSSDAQEPTDDPSLVELEKVKSANAPAKAKGLKQDQDVSAHDAQQSAITPVLIDHHASQLVFQQPFVDTLKNVFRSVVPRPLSEATLMLDTDDEAEGDDYPWLSSTKCSDHGIDTCTAGVQGLDDENTEPLIDGQDPPVK